MTAKPLPCPCGGADYATCCGRYHNGTPAPDAATLMKPLPIRLGHQAALHSHSAKLPKDGDVSRWLTPANSLVMMRSRYSAYALKLEAYVLATWHSSTRPAMLGLATDNTKWLGLEIKKHTAESADRATVEFIARYKIGGRTGRLHEVSRFVREDGKWFYVDGEFVNTAKD
jgi:SEC-C motif-containing protein